MKKTIFLCAFLFLLTGCIRTDKNGGAAHIPDGIKSAVVLNSNCYKMLEVLGVEDTVTGIADNMKETVNKNIPVVGSWNKPNIEKILEIRPDIVFAYQNYIPDESLRHLENAGIKVLFLEFYKPGLIPEEIEKLGRLYGKEEAAQKYIDSLNGQKEQLTQRLKNIPENERRTVYYETANGSSVSEGTGGDELITGAFCINIAGDEKALYPKLSDEWILEQDPDVIVKIAYDDKDIAAAYEKLLNRAGWKNLKAVKEGKVILLTQDLATSPDGFISATFLIAKTAYPELFGDIDPLEVYAEMRSRFPGYKSPSGIMIYPPLQDVSAKAGKTGK